MIKRFKGSRSDYWNTPKKMYDTIIQEGYIDYNPSNSYINPFYKDTEIYKKQKIFINPPFSILNKEEWIETIIQLINNDNEILLLVPSRTETKQFHILLELGFQVTFIKGRLKYNDQNCAPFPSLWMSYK